MDVKWVQGQKLLVEPYIEDFVKFNSNTGTVLSVYIYTYTTYTRIYTLYTCISYNIEV
jgi:hypothetical protein